MNKELDTKTVEQVNNMQFELDGNNLTIRVKLPSPELAPLSKSHKSKLYASTEGNISFGGFKMGLNIYKPLSGL